MIKVFRPDMIIKTLEYPKLVTWKRGRTFWYAVLICSHLVSSIACLKLEETYCECTLG